VALAERFEKHGESYFLFINDSTIVATNNFAEQDIRTLVMDRKVTQGVRSEGGNEWHERFWTTVASCRRQGRNVMAFLQDAIYGFFTVFLRRVFFLYQPQSEGALHAILTH